MNTSEYITLCGSEESEELATAALRLSKALKKTMRFGPLSTSPYTGKTNVQEIVDEFNDLLAVIELLQDSQILPMNIVDKEKIEAKKQKLLQYYRYSREAGCIND